MRTHRVTTGLVLLGALALAGCTAPNEAGDVPTTSPAPTTTEASPQERITELLTEVGTSADPALCTEAYTEQALAQLAQGEDPLAECEAGQADRSSTTEVAITDVVVEGGRASATMTPTGGVDGGLALSLALVDQDGWRIDELVGVTILDRASFDEANSATVRSLGASLMEPEKIECVDATLRAESDETFQDAVVAGSLSGVVTDALRDCIGAGTDLAAILFLSSHQLEQAGLTRDQADCVAGLAVVDYGELTLDDIVTDPAAKEQWLQGLRDAAEYGADDVGADSSVCAKA